MQHSDERGRMRIMFCEPDCTPPTCVSFCCCASRGSTIFFDDAASTSSDATLRERRDTCATMVTERLGTVVQALTFSSAVCASCRHLLASCIAASFSAALTDIELDEATRDPSLSGANNVSGHTAYVRQAQYSVTVMATYLRKLHPRAALDPCPR